MHVIGPVGVAVHVHGNDTVGVIAPPLDGQGSFYLTSSFWKLSMAALSIGARDRLRWLRRRI